MLFTTANAQQIFKLNHAWELCSLCEQTKGHYYTVKDADLIKDKDLQDYAIIYKSRKNGGNYLFGTDADKDCPRSNSGKHSWKTYSETLTINVTNKDLQDFIKLRDNERNEENQKKCEAYKGYAMDYRIGVVNTTLYRLCLYMEYFWGARNLKEFYWDNINLTNIEKRIFSENINGANVNKLSNLNINDFKIIIDLYEMILKDECKVMVPLSDKEIEYYGRELGFCNIDNSELIFSLNPNVLLNFVYNKYCTSCQNPFIAEYSNTVLRLSYAMALQKMNRKNEALEIYNKSDLTKLLNTLPVGYRADTYYFSQTSDPGKKSSFDIEPDKNDRIFGYMSIFSYINLCKYLNVQPKITEKELEGYLNEYSVSEKLRLVPSDYWFMASNLINQSDYPNAMHLLKFGIGKFPNNQNAIKNLISGYNSIGWNLILKKEFQSALLYLKEGSEIFPNDLFIRNEPYTRNELGVNGKCRL